MGFIWLADENEPDWVANAKSRPMLVSIGTNIRDSLPANLDQVVKNLFNTDEAAPEEPAPGETETERET